MLSKPKTRPQYDIKKTSSRTFTVPFPSKGGTGRNKTLKMEDRNTPETARVITRARNEWKAQLKGQTSAEQAQFFKTIGIPETAREKIPEGKFEKGTIVQIPNLPDLFGLTKATRGENQTLDINLTVKRTTSIQNGIAQAARYAQELNMPGQSISLKFKSNGKWVSTPFMEPDADNLYEALERALGDASQSGDVGNSSTGTGITIAINTGGGSGEKLPAWIGEKGGRAMFQIINADDLCGQRCLAVLVNETNRTRMYKSRPKTHTADAQKIAEEIGCPGKMTHDDFEKFSQIQKTSIVIFDGKNSIIHTTGTEYAHADTDLYLYYDKIEEHYHVIKNVLAFNGGGSADKHAKWCGWCKDTFTDKTINTHNCEQFKCYSCQTYFKSAEELEVHRVKEGGGIYCGECNRWQPNKACADAHMTFYHTHKKGAAKGTTRVSTDWKCEKFGCGQCMPIERHNAGCHECHEDYCTNCDAYFSKGSAHRCYIKKPDLKPSMSEMDEYWAFDFEALISSKVETLGDHTINLTCGRDIMKPGAYVEHNTLDEFIDFILSFKRKVTFVAHNGKGYDTLLIHKKLCEKMGDLPKPKDIILAGQKVMQLKVGKVRFIDSLNHIPGTLASFPKTFGLDPSKFKKGYFPYRFMTEGHENYIGPLPEMDYFEYQHMMCAKTHIEGVRCNSSCDLCDFLKWYEVEDAKDEPYDLKKELVEYCRSDVDILAESLKVYRECGINTHKIDPLKSITAAGAASIHYRTNHAPTANQRQQHDPKLQHKPVANITDICILTADENKEIRRAFKGGRTESFQLHRKLTEKEIADGWRIVYRDVVSEYPTVQFFDSLPCGAPLEKEYGEDGVTCAEGFPDDFYGFVECDVTCPQGLHVPLLGARKMVGKDEKYVFDLTPIKKQLLCSPELHKAKELGYEITRVYKTIEFEHTKDLFKTYMRECVGGKTVAAGFKGTEEERLKFVADHLEKLGMDISAISEEKNPGKKTINKLSANSLWGKYGTRLMKKTKYCTRSEWFKMVRRTNDKEIIMHDRVDMGDSVFVTYEELEDNKTSLANTNVALCAMVTSNARLRLYETLGQAGENLLYCDTDSAIILVPPGGYCPKEGDMLGEWSDELDGDDFITEFCTIAPKCYAYNTYKGKKEVKSKGMTLNAENLKVINLEAYKEAVDESFKTDEDAIMNGTQLVFKKSSKGITTSRDEKSISFNHRKTKRVFSADYKSHPFRCEM
jgi:hypothetical protein